MEIRYNTRESWVYYGPCIIREVLITYSLTYVITLITNPLGLRSPESFVGVAFFTLSSQRTRGSYEEGCFGSPDDCKRS